jgi:Apea-like HEPN
MERMAKLTVEQALRTVERTARESVEWPTPPAVPQKYRMNVHQKYRPIDHQVDALEELEAALAVDARFEYMKERQIKEIVEGFANAAFVHRDAKNIPAFLAEHAEEPQSLVCSFPVEGLAVHRELELFGVTFMPPEQAEIPKHMLGPGHGPIGTVVSTTCEGTSGTAMKDRASKKVEHALRQLRAGLREHRSIPDQQLRFRLGTTYWFSGGGGGWSTRSDQIIDVGLNDELVELVTSTGIARLPAEGGTRIEKAARRALRWFDDALLATDPLKEVLYLFFALEAILGDTSEKLKDENLALRRALLSHKLGQAFTNPKRIYGLYGKVRSKAVHGGEPIEVSKSEVTNFQWDVRRAINEFLEYARKEGFSKPGKLLMALDSDPVREEIKANFLPD